jgi:hypothetical protein
MKYFLKLKFKCISPPVSSNSQEGVRAGILYMRSKNFVKAVQGTHPPQIRQFQ